MKKVVLAGGTGHLGSLLAKAFVCQGWSVVILTRNVARELEKNIEWVEWDGENLGNWCKSLEGADTVINLSGKSIQCRFTDGNKKEMYDSRINPTRILADCIQSLSLKPKLWINFSGVSLFNGLKTWQDEDSVEIGTGFLATLSRDWEKAFFEKSMGSVNQVVLRISPVLSPKSGFFGELLPLVKLGLGGQVADGKQWMNWIHEEDLIRLIFWLIDHNSPSKIYHACSPKAISNASFMSVFRKIVGISFGLPLPSLLAKIGARVKGVDSSLLLDSVPVITTKTIEEGFVFLYPNAELAIEQLLHK